MGSALRVRVARDSTRHAIDAARRAGVRLIALDTSGHTSLFSADLRPPTAILLGSEGGGLPSEILNDIQERIAIPMTPPVESLNVGVAAALVLYEALRQRT
jgi:tRNA G18 (ribose-2'-O)-methylase SpoU